MIDVYLHGLNVAHGCGREVKARGMSGPIGKLARILIDDGYAEHDLMRVWRGSTMCFIPAPLSFWAGYDCTESEATGLRRIKHVPFSGDVFA